MSKKQSSAAELYFSDDELSSDARMPDNLMMLDITDLERERPPRPSAPLPFLWEGNLPLTSSPFSENWELPLQQNEDQEKMTYGGAIPKRYRATTFRRRGLGSNNRGDRYDSQQKRNPVASQRQRAHYGSLNRRGRYGLQRPRSRSEGDQRVVKPEARRCQGHGPGCVCDCFLSYIIPITYASLAPVIRPGSNMGLELMAIYEPRQEPNVTEAGAEASPENTVNGMAEILRSSLFFEDFKKY